MKRNLFAILLVVALVAALVFVVSPDAKAANGFLTATKDGETFTVSAADTVLNLNGMKDVVVKIENGVTLSVIDTSFIVDDETVDLTGKLAGTLTVDSTSNGTIAPVAFYGDFRYLAVETKGTYSFHPFNLAITKLGINTIGEAVCIRATFIANDVVRDILKAEGNDYGLKSVSGEDFSAKEKDNYKFGSKNRVQAYFDLKGSFDADNLDVTDNYQAYMIIDGKEVLSNYVLEVTPREVLKTLNKQEDLNPTAAQENAIKTITAKNAHLADLFTSVTKEKCTHSAKAAATCLVPETCKNCDVHTGDKVDLIYGHNADENHFCPDCKGYSIDANASTHIKFDGSSTAWELTGTINRATEADILTLAFMIGDGEKSLQINAATSGIVFGALDGKYHNDPNYARYAYHSFDVTQYNLNTTVQSQFTNKESLNQGQMHFKAVIVDDVFYVWFGFSKDNMTLCWYVPLTETLKGNPYRIDASQRVWDDSFKGFAPGSSYTLELLNNNANTAGSFTDLSVKTGEAVDEKQVPEFVAGITTGTVDENGDVSILSGQSTDIKFAGHSTAWELDGTIKRTGTADLNFAFVITDGNRKLRISASNSIGICFGNIDKGTHDVTGFDYARYGHHLHDVTQYNLDGTVLKQFSKDKTQNNLRFKAMIVDDVFYVWYGFSEDEMTLCWYVPLTETLTAVLGKDAWNNPFKGFDPGSSYTLELLNYGGAAGSFADLSVKTGEDVNEDQVPTNYVASVTGGTVDENGDVSILNDTSTAIQFAGSSTAWELDGTIKRTDTTKDLCFAFVITDGSKELKISASNQVGLCFGNINSDTHIKENPGYGRYPYHLFNKTDYNLDTTVLKQFSVNTKTQHELRFKAMIVNDVFYVWYWYGEDTPTLCWRVPLKGTLVGCVHEGKFQEWGTPFTGFTGGTYTLELLNYGGAAGSFADLSVKTGFEAPKFVTTSNVTDVDNMAGSFTSVPQKLGNVALAGASKTWEISGKIDRSDDLDQLSLGFAIQSGSKSLKVSAVTRGPYFDDNGSNHSATGTHAITGYGSTTEYNKNPEIGYFLVDHTKSTMYFKAIIADDMFYAWFWFDDPNAIPSEPSWIIPLDTQITAGWTTPFAPFAEGSTYQVSLYVRQTASATTSGTFSNLTVKTGANVDTSIIPAN